MIRNIALVVLALTIITLVFSCPNRDDHMLAVKNGLTRILNDKAESEGDKFLCSIFMPMFIDKVVDNQIDVTNYIFFSTASVYREDGNKTISVGILGNVYFFDGFVREALGSVEE